MKKCILIIFLFINMFPIIKNRCFTFVSQSTVWGQTLGTEKKPTELNEVSVPSSGTTSTTYITIVIEVPATVANSNDNSTSGGSTNTSTATQVSSWSSKCKTTTLRTKTCYCLNVMNVAAKQSGQEVFAYILDNGTSLILPYGSNTADWASTTLVGTYYMADGYRNLYYRSNQQFIGKIIGYVHVHPDNNTEVSTTDYNTYQSIFSSAQGTYGQLIANDRLYTFHNNDIPTSVPLSSVICDK